MRVMVGMTAQGVTVPVDGYRMPDAGWRLLGSAYGPCVAERDFPRIADLHLSGRLQPDRIFRQNIWVTGRDMQPHGERALGGLARIGAISDEAEMLARDLAAVRQCRPRPLACRHVRR